MTKKQTEHLTDLMLEFNNILKKKYAKGAKQHGGNLWEKKDLIDMAIEEAVDQVTYLLTLKQQIKDKTIYSVTGVDEDA